jgi:hypothetical protein
MRLLEESVPGQRRRGGGPRHHGLWAPADFVQLI